MSPWNIVTIFTCCFIKCSMCCPLGYKHCAVDGEICDAQSSIIAYGKDVYQWYFHQRNRSGSFLCDKHIISLGRDPVPGLQKECCYYKTEVNVSNISTVPWIAGNIHCNQRIYAFLAYENETHFWEFTNPQSQYVLFGTCGSSISHTTLYLYDDQQKNLNLTSFSQDHWCDTQQKEVFVANPLSSGTYYLRFSSSGKEFGSYQIFVECPQDLNYQYNNGLLSCTNNTISSTTTAINQQQFFEFNSGPNTNFTVSTCGSAWDTALYFYTSSAYPDHRAHALFDRDACDSGNQETVEITVNITGAIYIKLMPSDKCRNSSCFGNYTLTITCFNSAFPTFYPTMEPTLESTIEYKRITTDNDLKSEAEEDEQTFLEWLQTNKLITAMFGVVVLLCCCLCCCIGFKTCNIKKQEHEAFAPKQQMAQLKSNGKYGININDKEITEVRIAEAAPTRNPMQHRTTSDLIADYVKSQHQPNEIFQSQRQTNAILKSLRQTNEFIRNESLSDEYIQDDNFKAKEIDLEEIHLWLTFDVKLPKYYANFAENGYETIAFIKEIGNEIDLEEIGIDDKEDRIHILKAIKMLDIDEHNESNENYTGGETGKRTASDFTIYSEGPNKGGSRKDFFSLFKGKSSMALVVDDENEHEP